MVEAMAVHVTRVIEAPRYRVFRAWTDPEEVVKWWAPPEYTAPGFELNLSLGGDFRFDMVAPDGRPIAAVGTFAEIDGAARLVMTWNWEGTELDGVETTVTVRFRDRGEATEVEVSHASFSDPEVAAQIEEGWTGCLSRLADCLPSPE